jgi:hypothetical protein
LGIQRYITKKKVVSMKEERHPNKGNKKYKKEEKERYNERKKEKWMYDMK